MGEFKLVNPVIMGTFKDTYTAQTSADAAKQFWTNLTIDNKYITGNVPKFLFTLMNTNDEKLHHFMVREKQNGSSAEFEISNVDVTLSDSQKGKFLAEISKVKKNVNRNIKQNGGRKHHRKSSSSSSDSDSDIDDLFNYIKLKKAKKPLLYWWYTPTIYDVDTLFTPTFAPSYDPYVQLWMPTVFV